MLPRAPLLALVLLVPAFAAALPGDGVASLVLPCDQPTDGVPCNLRMTFEPNRGNENYLALNPLDPDNLVGTSKDYGLTGAPGVQACSVNNVWTGYYTTTDGGRTWTNGYARGHPGSPTTPISKYRCSTDAVVGADNQGTFFLSGLAYNSTGATSAIWVAKSTDGGVTFADPRIGDEANFNDKNWIAVDPASSHVYITWTHFNTNSGIWFKRSLGGSLDNWDARQRLSGASSGGAQGSFPAVGPDGTVYVIWNDNILGGNGNLYIVKSTDHGASFTAERAAFQYNGAPWSGDAPYRTPNIPALAVDRSNGPFRGTLYVTYQGQTHGDPDSFLRYSRDGGETWSAEIRLNDDPVGNDKGQNFATVAVDPATGWVHTVWYDRRDDPNNRAHHTYYAVSKDGGQSWSKNQRVSTHLSAPDACRHQDGSMFIGDYLGIAAAGGKARPAFVDTRNGRCDLYTAALFAGPRLTVEARPHLNVSVSEDLGIKVQAFTDLTSAVAEIDLPLHLTIEATGGGTVVPGPDKNTVRWNLGAVSGDREITLRVRPTQPTVVDLQARLDWSLVADGTASGRAQANATVLISYPVLELGLLLPPNVPGGSAFHATALVVNKGFGPATEATVELLLPGNVVAVPKGGNVTTEPLAAGAVYGIPASDPTGVPAQKVRWTLPSIAAQSSTTYTLLLLSPPVATPGSSTTMRFADFLNATAPDGAALAAAVNGSTRLTSANPAALQATPTMLVEYLTRDA